MNTAQPRIQLAGILYAAAGMLWFLLIAGAAALGIPLDRPQTAAFYAAEALFVVIQLLLLAGFFGLWWSGGVGRRLFGRIAFGLAALPHLLFVLVEAHSLILGELSPLFPLAPLSSAVGLLRAGIAVLTTRQWQGWTRWIPLTAGLYPWLCMFPFLALTGEPNEYAIGGWGLARLALGLAIYTQASYALPLPR
ncbi:MAG: hypothetical protein H3C34_05705 [Caldilineaceae bacterium]|nr:hypothetical protein [Caldilineaceae bacterium]